MPLTDNLISFWELEEASGTRVDSVVASANDLTDNNTVTQNPGKVGNAAQFTAANSESLSHVDNTGLRTGNIDQTWCAWVYLDSKPAPDNIIIGKANGTGVTAGYEVLRLNSTDRFTFLMRPVGGGGAVVSVQATTFGVPPLATWCFIAAWFDSVAGTGFISVNDGTSDSAAKTGTPGSDTVGFRLGSNDDPGAFLDGRIDQVGLWKRVLTAAERTFLYNSGNGRSYAQIVVGLPDNPFLNFLF